MPKAYARAERGSTSQKARDQKVLRPPALDVSRVSGKISDRSERSASALMTPQSRNSPSVSAPSTPARSSKGHSDAGKARRGLQESARSRSPSRKVTTGKGKKLEHASMDGQQGELSRAADQATHSQLVTLDFERGVAEAPRRALKGQTAGVQVNHHGSSLQKALDNLTPRKAALAVELERAQLEVASLKRLVTEVSSGKTPLAVPAELFYQLSLACLSGNTRVAAKPHLSHREDVGKSSPKAAGHGRQAGKGREGGNEGEKRGAALSVAQEEAVSGLRSGPSSVDWGEVEQRIRVDVEGEAPMVWKDVYRLRQGAKPEHISSSCSGVGAGETKKGALGDHSQISVDIPSGDEAAAWHPKGNKTEQRMLYSPREGGFSLFLPDTVNAAMGHPYRRSHSCTRENRGIWPQSLIAKNFQQVTATVMEQSFQLENQAAVVDNLQASLNRLELLLADAKSECADDTKAKGEDAVGKNSGKTVKAGANQRGTVNAPTASKISPSGVIPCVVIEDLGTGGSNTAKEVEIEEGETHSAGGVRKTRRSVSPGVNSESSPSDELTKQDGLTRKSVIHSGGAKKRETRHGDEPGKSGDNVKETPHLEHPVRLTGTSSSESPATSKTAVCGSDLRNSTASGASAESHQRLSPPSGAVVASLTGNATTSAPSGVQSPKSGTKGPQGKKADKQVESVGATEQSGVSPERKEPEKVTKAKPPKAKAITKKAAVPEKWSASAEAVASSETGVGDTHHRSSVFQKSLWGAGKQQEAENTDRNGAGNSVETSAAGTPEAEVPVSPPPSPAEVLYAAPEMSPEGSVFIPPVYYAYHVGGQNAFFIPQGACAPGATESGEVQAALGGPPSPQSGERRVQPSRGASSTSHHSSLWMPAGPCGAAANEGVAAATCSMSAVPFMWNGLAHPESPFLAAVPMVPATGVWRHAEVPSGAGALVTEPIPRESCPSVPFYDGACCKPTARSENGSVKGPSEASAVSRSRSQLSRRDSGALLPSSLVRTACSLMSRCLARGGDNYSSAAPSEISDGLTGRTHTVSSAGRREESQSGEGTSSRRSLLHTQVSADAAKRVQSSAVGRAKSCARPSVSRNSTVGEKSRLNPVIQTSLSKELLYETASPRTRETLDVAKRAASLRAEPDQKVAGLLEQFKRAGRIVIS
ncbi:hypothetical protein TGMAS_250820 [Toxoplasma gondii MAS]|uniref:Uncharacterized protein n=1 Tax=Toxoplasma gondii MAS TaxID=943118 RepID=A0A086PQJ7_TOXGO|nr:hypothetical protein TGMAS_250820 [Toxoplasma gondii MAS]